MRLTIEAPAKVNLCLLVGPRRPDGYHELFSIFAPVALFDTLEFDLSLLPPGAVGPGPVNLSCIAPVAASPAAEGLSGAAAFVSNGFGSPGMEGGDNLVVKAFRAVEGLSGRAITGTVRLKKRIPVGAGLGGGSSDAAAALGAAARLLVEEAGISLEQLQLHHLARGLGADVPFFLEGRAAMATGIGDVLKGLNLPGLPLVVVIPGEHLATRDVYAAFDEQPAPGGGVDLAVRAAAAAAAWIDLGSPSSAAGAVSSQGACGPSPQPEGATSPGGAAGATPESAAASPEIVATIASLLENDLEAASFALLPSLVDRKRAVTDAGAMGALMSGSGPTMFGVCSSPAQAEETARHLREGGYPTLVTSTVVPEPR